MFITPLSGSVVLPHCWYYGILEIFIMGWRVGITMFLSYWALWKAFILQLVYVGNETRYTIYLTGFNVYATSQYITYIRDCIVALEIFMYVYGFYTEGAEDRTSSMATHWLSAEDSTWKVWQHPANMYPMPEKPTALLNWPTEGIGMLVHLSDFLDSFALWLVYPSCTHFTLKGSNIDSVGLWVIWVQALSWFSSRCIVFYCIVPLRLCVCVCVSE